MAKNLRDIISEETYGNTKNLDLEKYPGTPLPRPSRYTDNQKFKRDLQKGITRFLKDLDYDPLTDDIQFQSEPEFSYELNLSDSEIIEGKFYNPDIGRINKNY